MKDVYYMIIYFHVQTATLMTSMIFYPPIMRQKYASNFLQSVYSNALCYESTGSAFGANS